jgi:hypothetical protein
VLHLRHIKGRMAAICDVVNCLGTSARLNCGMAGTKRQQEINAALRLLTPGMLLEDALAVKSEAMRGTYKALTPAVAAWLALTSHIRHVHTDYDALLDEGYDRSAARFFVVAAMDEKLTEWGCSRSVADGDDHENEPDAATKQR